MGLKLYFLEASPPVRATLLTIHALGLEDQVEFVTVNIFAGEQFTPEYLQKNPLHTIPTLEDDGFIVFDSHAIMPYLVDKYGKDDSLYPKDLQKRAIVNQRLHFDNGTLFHNLAGVIGPILRGKAKTIKKEAADSLVKTYESLETLLGNNKFAAGDQVTIADFSLVATLTTGNVLVPVASNRFPKVSEWLSRMQALPYYHKANQAGIDKFLPFLKSKMS